MAISPFLGPRGLSNLLCRRWSFYILIIWAFIQWICITLVVPETYHPVLLRTKARKLRKETGNDRWHAPMEKTKKSITQVSHFKVPNVTERVTVAIDNHQVVLPALSVANPGTNVPQSLSIFRSVAWSKSLSQSKQSALTFRSCTSSSVHSPLSSPPTMGLSCGKLA